MKTLAALLLALVAVVHYAGDELADLYADPEAARRAIYYVARSIEGATQYAVIALLAISVRRERLRGVKDKDPGRLKGAPALLSSATGLVAVACCWGIAEHLQAAACRLSVGISNRVPSVAPLTGMCDAIADLPVYALSLGAGAFITAVIAAYPGEH